MFFFCVFVPWHSLLSQSRVLGEVEGCPTHRPASVPGRMDVSMCRGVSVKLLTVKQSQSERTLPSTGQHVAHSSLVHSSRVGVIQKGCVWMWRAGLMKKKGWGWGTGLLLLCADTHWTHTNIHRERVREKGHPLSTFFFYVRIVFRMSLGSREAESAMRSSSKEHLRQAAPVSLSELWTKCLTRALCSFRMSHSNFESRECL